MKFQSYQSLLENEAIEIELLKHVTDFSNLEFRFVVGPQKQRIIPLPPSGIEARFRQSGYSLKFVNGVNIPNDVKEVLRHSTILFLDRHKNIKHLSEFELKNLEQLRVCIVGKCNEMQTLIDGGSPYNDNTLRYLEFLCLFYMSDISSLCNQREVFSPSCFGSLKTIALHTCLSLTTILTMNFLDNLSNLEELIVEDCPKVSTLITLESFEPTVKYFLPRLRKLSLLYLPELESISSGLFIGPKLERIGFYDCPKLLSLSTLELSSKNLQVIKAEEEWWHHLIWKEAEWGTERQPEYFQCIFVPIDEDADILDQLVRDDYESSRSKVEESQVI